jgi:hypothetical protein
VDKEDIWRLYFPADAERRRQAREMDHERAKARAAEEARLEVQREHETSSSRPKTQRVAIKRKRNLTPVTKRTKKIRGVLLSQTSRPDLETYVRLMDEGQISPPPACRRAGKRTFEESFKVPNLRRVISAEFSRLWQTRSQCSVAAQS